MRKEPYTVEGLKCRQCGSTRRYASNGQCYPCAVEYQERYAKGKQLVDIGEEMTKQATQAMHGVRYEDAI